MTRIFYMLINRCSIKSNPLLLLETVVFVPDYQVSMSTTFRQKSQAIENCHEMLFVHLLMNNEYINEYNNEYINICWNLLKAVYHYDLQI